MRAAGKSLLIVHMIPPPNQIFASFERGEIAREEVHALMSFHARELIQEMQDDYQNPATALLELLLQRRHAAQLVRCHGSRALREILIALSELEDFPPSKNLWNASHPDVPLHCFFRMRRAPVFRITAINLSAGKFKVDVEHGQAGRGKASRRSFQLKRDNLWLLRVQKD